MVESENPFTGGRQHICKAFFVFVAKPSDGGKVRSTCMIDTVYIVHIMLHANIGGSRGVF